MKSEPYLFITKNFPPAICGVGDYTYFTAKELSKLGFKVHILTSQADNLERSEFKVHPLIKNFSILGIFKILKEIKKIKPDIINFQYLPQISGKFGFSFSSGILALLIKMFTPHKLIITFHELYIAFGKRPIFWPLALIQRINLYLICLFANAIIVTTRKRKDLLTKYFPKKLINYIPVGSNIPVVPQERDEKEKLRKNYSSDKDFLFASFGTASRDKDYIFLIKLISELNNNSLPSKLLMIGDIERDPLVLSSIKKSIICLKMESKIYLTGNLVKEEISKLLGASDFFLANQKKGITTGSGTLVAAFSHEIPIIANQKDNADEIFKNRKNVFLVNMENPLESTKEIINLISSKELVENVRRGESETFASYFAWGIIANQITKIKI